MNEPRSISIVIPGKPTARLNPIKGRFGVYDPQKALKNELRFFFQIMHPGFAFLKGPLSLDFIFHIAMPSSWSKKKRESLLNTLHTSKPDTSNMLKHLEDCCTGIFFKDDCQIAMIHGKKIWSNKAETHVTIREVNDEKTL